MPPLHRNTDPSDNRSVPHTLLLADDSVTIQRVIELTFADEDVVVVAVSNGDQAIDRLESSPPDIVLADIGMPGKNGYEVAQYIKRSPKLSHIPVVLLTGAFEPVDQARAAAAGCDGVLAKPFEPQLVIGRVKELLANVQRVPASVDEQLAPPTQPDGQWTPTVVDMTLGARPAAPVAPTQDDYFDRLDAAFAGLSGAPVAAPPAPATAVAPPPALPTEIDWFGAPPESSAPAEPWDLPAPPAEVDAVDLSLSYASAQSALETPSALPHEAPKPLPPELELTTAVAPAAAGRATLSLAPPEAAAPVQPAALPSLADAFAALLAAEQREPQPATALTWPEAGPQVDALVEHVARKVLERLSMGVGRETVADVVSQTAERLIREEIDRIKASVQ